MTYTENYELNQWQKSDRIMMSDFNSDNAKIDAALAAVVENGPKLAVGTYTGTGTDTDTTVTVGFPVKALLVTTGNSFDGQNGLFIVQGQTVSGGWTGQVFWFTDTGFCVKTAKYEGNVCPPYLNTTSTHYYVAIG